MVFQPLILTVGLLWSDAEVWRADDAFAAYVHGWSSTAGMRVPDWARAYRAGRGSRTGGRERGCCGSIGRRPMLAFAATTPGTASAKSTGVTLMAPGGASCSLKGTSCNGRATRWSGRLT